jgi:hypothetical protein
MKTNMVKSEQLSNDDKPFKTLSPKTFKVKAKGVSKANSKGKVKVKGKEKGKGTYTEKELFGDDSIEDQKDIFGEDSDD